MRATRNFIAHRRNPPETRTFLRGEWIPEEWRASINAQVLVDAPLPHLDPTPVDQFASLAGCTTVNQVVGWVHETGDREVMEARARHALQVEEGPEGRQRKSLIRALAAVLGGSDGSE